MKLKLHSLLMVSIIVAIITLFSIPVWGTDVGGVINENTTWDLVGSPYILTEDVHVAEGVTLTIDPGVVVQGGGLEIRIWGILNAIGTDSSFIIFNNVNIHSQENTSDIIIQFSEIYSGSCTIDPGGILSLKDSKIQDLWVSYLHLQSGDCYIERNIFFNTSYINVSGVLINPPDIAKLYLRNNVFYQQTSDWAVKCDSSLLEAIIIAEYNSFLSTDRVALRLSSYGEITAINNFWNTTDTSVIDIMIYDKSDDNGVQNYIVYEPILTAPHPDTPAFPTANFSADTTIGLPPLTVIFTDESIGPIDSWAWNFGDGSTSDQQDPIHIYENLGRYTVSLNVSGPIASDTVVKTDYITVGDAPDLVGRCKEFHSYEFSARIKVKVEIGNTGTEKASRFNVALYLSDDGTTRNELIGLDTVMGGLNSQHTKVVSLGYESEIPLSSKYIITVIDPDLQVLEFDDTNNEFATRIP